MKKNDNIKKSFLDYGLTAFFVLCGAIAVIFVFINLNNIFSFINRIFIAISPVLIGILMAYIVYPFYAFIYKFVKNKLLKSKSIKYKKPVIENISKVVAVVLSILLWIIILGGLLLLVIPEFYVAIATFLQNIDKYRISIENFIYSINFLQNRKDIIDLLESVFNDFIDFSSRFLLPNVNNINNILKGIYSGLLNTVSVVFNLVVGLIIMVYVLYKKDSIILGTKKFLFAICPKKVANKILEEIRYANVIFTHFFSGKIVESLIIGIICYLGVVFLIRIPYAYAFLISVVVGVTNIIPFFGPIVGAVISIVFIFFVDPIKSIYFIIFILILQQFDGNILGPKVLSTATGVDNFYVLCATLLFGGIFGFVGMIIAVPLWAVLSRVMGEIVDAILDKKGMPTDVNEYKNK